MAGLLTWLCWSSFLNGFVTEQKPTGMDKMMGMTVSLCERTGILQLPSSVFKTHSSSLVLHRFIFAIGHLLRTFEMGATVINQELINSPGELALPLLESCSSFLNLTVVVCMCVVYLWVCCAGCRHMLGVSLSLSTLFLGVRLSLTWVPSFG